jgi:hypothetical protein
MAASLVLPVGGLWGWSIRLLDFFACAALWWFCLWRWGFSGFSLPVGGLPAAPWFRCLPTVLAFPCFAFGLLASPLCGAALTFFAAA